MAQCEAVLTVKSNPNLIRKFMGLNSNEYPCNGQPGQLNCLADRAQSGDSYTLNALNQANELKDTVKLISICNACPVYAQCFPKVLEFAEELQAVHLTNDAPLTT